MEPVARNRSRSPRALEREPDHLNEKMTRERIAHLERVLDCKNAELDAKNETLCFLKQRLNVELEMQLHCRNQERDAAKHKITMKDIEIAGLRAQCDCKDGLIAILKDQITALVPRKTEMK